MKGVNSYLWNVQNRQHMLDMKSKAVFLTTLLIINIVSFLFGGVLGFVVFVPSIGFALHVLRR